MKETIYPGHRPCTYKPYQVIGGWKVMYLDEHGNLRVTDGDKLYPSRQNAYRCSKRLNDAIKAADEMIARDGAIIL